jgi:ribosomal protein S18 acetylase RimI-like enzyme
MITAEDVGVQLTLVRPLDLASRPTAYPCPDGYSVRPTEPADIEALAALYLAAYPPTEGAATLPQATAELAASFAGEFGPLWLDLSLVARDTEQQPVSAIQVVRRAPWDDTPPGPFVIELFTSPDHRRRGLGRHLLTEALRGATESAETVIGLRVESENGPAVSLYRDLGFTDWPPQRPPRAKTGAD